MKITVDVDITPEELRRFLGLPNVEGLQEEMLRVAQQRMEESGQTFFNDMVTGAVQPLRRDILEGSRSFYHYNALQAWQVSPEGELSNVYI